MRCTLSVGNLSLVEFNCQFLLHRQHILANPRKLTHPTMIVYHVTTKRVRLRVFSIAQLARKQRRLPFGKSGECRVAVVSQIMLGKISVGKDCRIADIASERSFPVNFLNVMECGPPIDETLGAESAFYTFNASVTTLDVENYRYMIVGNFLNVRTTHVLPRGVAIEKDFPT